MYLYKYILNTCYIHVIYMLYTCYLQTGSGRKMEGRWSKYAAKMSSE